MVRKQRRRKKKEKCEEKVKRKAKVRVKRRLLKREVDDGMDMESCKQHGLSRKSKQKI